jgi:flagellar basal-body rod protein FlgB
MDLTTTPLLDVLRARMTWLNARQGVLSQNVSNADTPGYVAQDIKPLDFEKVLENSTSKISNGLMTTDPRHISASSSASSAGGGLDVSQLESESGPQGQSVSQEEEMMKVSDTQAQYQAAANLYAKAVSMMRTAIGTP